MVIIAWVLIFALLAMFFARWESAQNNPNQTVESSITDNGAYQVILKRNRANHYVASGKINGQPVTFLVDTGASDVTIPESLAERLGLYYGIKRRARTANGTITIYSTTLDSLQIGNIKLTDIRASINPHMQGKEILLGMSALKNLKFTQQGGQLILTQE